MSFCLCCGHISGQLFFGIPLGQQEHRNNPALRAVVYSASIVPCSAVKATGILREYEAPRGSIAVIVRDAALLHAVFGCAPRPRENENAHIGRLHFFKTYWYCYSIVGKPYNTFYYGMTCFIRVLSIFSSLFCVVLPRTLWSQRQKEARPRKTTSGTLRGWNLFLRPLCHPKYSEFLHRPIFPVDAVSGLY